MCLIIDACVAHKVFGEPCAEEARPIWGWLLRDGSIVYGGLLAEELKHSTGGRRRLAELLRSGKARLIGGEELLAMGRQISDEGNCKSNDLHVVALARTSGARVLFTVDGSLIEDFVNPKVLRPRGRVYQRSSHAHLLGHQQGCPGYKRAGSR